MQYRALRNEPRVGVANFTMDFVKGQVYEESEMDEAGHWPRGTVPSHIAKYLCSHGVLIDAQVSLEPAASPLPEPAPRPRQAVLVEGQKPSMKME